MIAWPDLDGRLGDYPGALEAALQAPEGGRRLEELAGAGTRVAIGGQNAAVTALPFVAQT